MVTRIEATLTATLPHLATKAEVTELTKALPHLASKAEVADLSNGLPRLATKAEMAEILKTLPHLATKAELADKPGKAFLVSLAAIVVAAYGAGLAALSLLK